MTATNDLIRRQLTLAREKLISTDGRNPLIHFRRPAKSLALTGPSVADLATRLLSDKTLTFRPAHPKVNAAQPAVLVDPPRPLTAEQVQTELSEDKLIKTLTSIYRENTTQTSDQGNQVLYVGLGFLEWYEDAASQTLRFAPLVLVPVTLTRKNVNAGYALRFTGDDLMGNEPLALRLRQDFGITLPDLDPEHFDLTAYLVSVGGEVATQPRWRVRADAAHLGFFSFSRYLMARDLDADAWPAGQGPVEHEVIGSLLGSQGFASARNLIPEGALLDDHLPPSSTMHIVDADSSQALAIHAVSKGQHLLIQGPPGTGKSQTITNIIADAVMQGKTVLFVADKMAALEVVKRRLSQNGLGTAVLELHGHQTTRKAFIEQLRNASAAQPPSITRNAVDPIDLDASARSLNSYVDALHTPLAAFGITPYRALGEWAMLKIPQPPTIHLSDVHTWDLAALREREAVTQLLQGWVERFGPPHQHPFWGITARSLTPMELSRVRSALEGGVDALGQAGRLTGALSTDLGRDLGTTMEDLSGAAEAVLLLASAPDLRSVAVASTVWTEQATDFSDGLDRAERLSKVHALHETTVRPDAWTVPVGEWLHTLEAQTGKWWRMLSGPYRAARQGALGLLRERGRPDDATLLDLLRDLKAAGADQEVLERLTPLMASAVGSRWQGMRSDVEGLREVMAWTVELHKRASAAGWPAWVIQDAPALTASARTHQASARELRDLLDRALTQLIEAKTVLGFAGVPTDETLSAVEARWRTRRDLLDRAQEMAAFNNYAANAQDKGLGALLSLTSTWDKAGQHLVSALRRVWLDAMISAARHDRPVLSTFDATSHTQTIRQFRQLDEARLKENRGRAAAARFGRINRATHPAAWRVLNHQFNLKQRYRAIRTVMAEAGPAIQQLAPVFMMSPLSVAYHLPRGIISFDLVIFDEASQVRPEDGLGAITRGRQVVVVGDEKQLPPSGFFVGQDAPAEDNQDGDMVADLESLLGTFKSANAPQTMLRWHYRSRHESLIAVSNREFYDNRLVLFPSPDAGRSRLGLIYHHLPSAEYDAGASRTNRVEAREVASAVMRHARETPDQSLGVAAFSVAQADAILDELEILRRQDTSLEPFFDAGAEEPFFVKNLENVQGDERDAIFISIGYGRQASGKLSMNFGPLNKEGGQRRMNVLITRAKLRCEVFTNLRAEDLDLSATKSEGVRVLKTFLQYAATGRMDITAEDPDAEADSPFEEAVERALRANGHQVRRQVGSGGFRVDLAVVDPTAPGRYLLGVECDGATYHRSRSARDRDRLRQTVLENLGWRIHRIWSTDWFLDPARCMKELEVAIAAAKQAVAGRP